MLVGIFQKQKGPEQEARDLRVQLGDQPFRQLGERHSLDDVVNLVSGR